MVDLGKKKGYEPIYCSFGLNVFFVDARYYERFGIEDNSATALWTEPHPFVRQFDRSPEGRPGHPFSEGNEYIEVGDVRIKKKFVFDR